jgi:hypothetical protein
MTGVPGKTNDFFANAGLGLNYFVTPFFGVRLDARYIILFAKPDNIKILNTTTGFFFRF